MHLHSLVEQPAPACLSCKSFLAFLPPTGYPPRSNTQKDLLLGQHVAYINTTKVPPSRLSIPVLGLRLWIPPRPSIHKKWRCSEDSPPLLEISMTRARSCGIRSRAAGSVIPLRGSSITLSPRHQPLELPSPSISPVCDSLALGHLL